MKISVACICVFLFCSIYWALGLSQILISAENAIPSTTTSASILFSDNHTSDTEGYQTVLKSEGDLEYKADFVTKEILESAKEDEKQQEEYAFIDVVSQNSGVAHEIIGPSPGIIQTLVDSKILEKTEGSNSADTISSHHNRTPQLENTSLDENSVNIDTLESQTANKANVSVELNLEQGEESISINTSDSTLQTDNIGIEVPTVEPKNNDTTEKDKTQEEIPSFSEWTQKQLEEAEKKKEEANSSIQNQNVNGKSSLNIKKRWKNYASPDCGAKIIAANPEANSAGSVLTASRDEYKLNACTNRIWFIVELCEAIQAKKIELANFELFSSSPKDFSIFVSDRFPTRDWLSVGQFTAKDERDIQNFDLYPHLFGKYIKFEMYSHHGSEHYCPISLFRVFGTSEFEVLETENQVHDNTSGEEDDDDDDEPINVDSEESPKNLFSSATDAVISMVKKAAEVLGNKGNASSNGKVQQNATAMKYSPLISTCTTPSHIVVCDNCSDLLFGNVFELLSCSSREIVNMVSQPILKNVLYNTDVCSTFGLEFCTNFACSVPNSYKSYVSSLFAPKLIAAMCNVVAVNECKVVRNISSNATTIITQQSNESQLPNTKIIDLSFTDASEPVTDTIDTDHNTITTIQQDNFVIETTYTSQIKPTKTLTTDIRHDSINVTPSVTSSKHDESVILEDTPNIHSQNDSVLTTQNKTITQQMEHIEVSAEVVSDIESTESAEHLDLDTLVTDLNEESSNVASTTLSPPTVPQGQKESVFLRLSNRIKALERNMSLSSQYLEELSRRYKKQVEEMQRLLDKTINTFNEENKKKEEQSQHLEEQILLLRESIDILVEDKKAWVNTTYWLFFSGVVIVGILLFCRRNQELVHYGSRNRTNTSQIWRRMSVDGITNKSPVKKRRPSEEASSIGGTYMDLLIDDFDSNHRLKRRKRKRRSLQRSNSIPTLSEEAGDNCDNINRTINSEEFKFNPRITSSHIWRRKDSAPANVSSLNWVESVTNIQNAPLALDESEHSSLDPLIYSNHLTRSDSNTEKINNGDIHSNTFIVTATDSRAKRFLQKHKGSSNKVNEGHKKSLSFDESTKGSISLSAATDTTSLTNSINESTNRIIELPKKEKKNTLKRLFKSLNFK